MSASRLRLWRSGGELCGEGDGGRFPSLPLQETLMAVTLQRVAGVVISSLPKTQEYTLRRLGYFQYMGVFNDANYYVKKKVNKEPTTLYLFRGKDDGWWVDATFDGWGMARNRSSSLTVPEEGWECWQQVPAKWVPWHVMVENK